MTAAGEPATEPGGDGAGASLPAPRWLRALSRVFTPLAIACLIWFAWLARDTLQAVLAEARVDRLALATALWAAIQLLVPTCAHAVLGGMGGGARWSMLLDSHTARIPARYLPGGIWHTVGRVADLAGRGVGRRSLAGLVVLEQGLALCVTALAGGALILLFGHTPLWTGLAALGCAGGLLGLPLLWWVVNTRVLAGVVLPAAAYLRAVVLTLIFWSLAASAFVSYLSALPGTMPPGGALQASGIYLFAWAAGFVAVFAPQGIGVFELVAGDLLQVPLSMTSVAVLVAGFRVVVLLADVLVWLLSRAVVLWRRRTGERGQPP